MFNSFFLSHSSIDETNAKLPDGDIFDNEEIYLDHIDVTETEVADLIKNVDPNKAIGSDGISPKLLKEAGTSIVPSLMKLIQLSLQQSKVPNQWKKANVIPVHKKDSKNHLNNYRPISLLPAASKILELIIFKNLYNHLHDSKKFSKHQSGFRPNDSTVNQLSYIYHEFCKALDDKKDVRIVFCDISKAFDRVWHKGLLYKLRKAGITGSLLRWFENYLAERKQRVLIRGQSSLWGNIQAGVPQGSVLGPLLFLVYINDLADVVDCSIKMFADDTCLYVTVDDPVSSQIILNESLKNLKLWADQWLVKFNPSKTKTMYLSNRNNEPPPLHFSGEAVQEVIKHKHLGVTFNNKLTWKNHVQDIIGTVSKFLDIMHKLSKDLDRKSLEIIYQTFVRSKMEYSCIIWDDCSDIDKIALEKCQMRAARIVTGAKKGTSNDLLYSETKWLKLEERRDRFKLCFMHKILHEKTPHYLVEILPNTANDERHYHLRNNDNIATFKSRTEKLRKSLLPDCIRKWNNLDNNLKKEHIYTSFKNKIMMTEKCQSLFYIGIRKFNILHSQLRLNCSNLNAHLYGLHVVDAPTCACSHKFEDTAHFFLDCPLYCTERLRLRNIVIRYTEFKLETLLFGDGNIDYECNVSIVQAVHEFIRDSKRFDT